MIKGTKTSSGRIEPDIMKTNEAAAAADSADLSQRARAAGLASYLAVKMLSTVVRLHLLTDCG